MYLTPQAKRRWWPWIVGGVLAFFLLFGLGAWIFFKQLGIEGILSSSFVRSQLVDNSGLVDADIFDLLPEALGFVEPKTYLLLFLNNTELRPGGGFIGVYSVVRVDRGQVEVLALDGTESLDWNTKASPLRTAPVPVSRYLNVEGWFFRDSNWSPDFAESTRLGLELYLRENGPAVSEIDAVVGVSATVLERVMERVGSLTVEGITFTPENIVAQLQYEVEYEFVDRGISREDRKALIRPLMVAIIDALRFDVFRHPRDYRALVETLLKEKHIMAYALDPELQKTIQLHGADGAVVREYSHDYLLWVDANLGALKTDHALTRELSYTITPRVSETGESYYEARASMTYIHSHPFDWRTSRYRTYARVFVPLGSQLISVEGSMQTDRSTLPGEVHSGVELEKQWFGTFTAVEPFTTKTLTFVYRLPQSVADQLQNGAYQLLVQKQLGLTQARLTLDLGFGTTIQSAHPPEVSSEWGDSVYRIALPFDTDQTFSVDLTQ
jgi:hypothetical protein